MKALYQGLLPPGSTGDTLEDVGVLIDKANAALGGLRSIEFSGSSGIPSAGSRLAELLALRHLGLQVPIVYELGVATGVLNAGSLAEQGPIYDRFRHAVQDPRAFVRGLFPSTPLETKQESEAAMAILAERARGLLRALGVSCTLGYDPENEVILGDAAPFAAHAMLMTFSLAGGSIDSGLWVSLSSEEDDGLGVVVVPFGQIEGEFPFERWSVRSTLSSEIGAVSFGGTAGFRLVAEPPASSVRASVEAQFRSDGSVFVIGPRHGTRMEVHGARARMAVELQQSGSGWEVLVECERATLVLAGGDADPLSRSLFHGKEAKGELTLGIEYSTRTGLRLRGGGGLLARVPAVAHAGPVTVDAVALGVSVDEGGGRASFGCEIGVVLGPVRLRVDGLGLEARVVRPLAFGLGLRLPVGTGVGVEAGAVKGTGYLGREEEGDRYAGVLMLEALGRALCAIAVLDASAPGGFSLAAVVSVESPAVPIGLGFSLDGVGGLLGINRRVDADQLRAAARGEGIGDIFFPSDPVAHASRLLGDLARYFPATEGRHVFGPAFKLSWGTPTLVRATVALLLELPAPARVILLGTARATLPTPEKPIVDLGVDVVGEVDFGRKTVAIDASLRDSKVAGFPVTGDMALRMSWGSQPNFVLSVGGFHSRYQPPPGFPDLRRVRIPLGSGDNPRLDAQGFLALTSNTAQVGASVELYAEKWSFNIKGSLGFEALIHFSPFSFVVDLWAGVVFRRGNTVLAGVHLDGTLSGPSPWHVKGEACISLWFLDVCIGIDETFGRQEVVELPRLDIWADHLAAAVQEPSNWSSALPKGAARAVTTSAPEGSMRIDPVSTITFTQKVVPLNRKIERFAQAKPLGTNRFNVTEVTIGGTVVVPTPPPVKDWFAPAQFEAMSEAEKLSRPGYEKMDAGVAITADLVTVGTQLVKDLEYETIVFPEPEPLPTFYTPIIAHQLLGLQTSAAAAPPLQLGIAGVYAPPPDSQPLVTLNDEAYVIASTEDLAPRLDITGAASRSEVELALKEYLAAHPEAKGELQVVPSFELEAA